MQNKKKCPPFNTKCTLIYHVYVRGGTLGGGQEWGQFSLLLNCNNPENGNSWAQRRFPFSPWIILLWLSFIVENNAPTSRLGLGFSGNDTGERPGAGEQEGRASFRWSSMHLPPAAGMAGRHIGVFPCLFATFSSCSLSASQEVREGHQAHNPSWHLTEYPHLCWGKTPGHSGLSIQRRRNRIIYESNYFSLG